MLGVASFLTVATAASGAGVAPLQVHLPARVVANRSVTVVVTAARAQPVAELRLVIVAPKSSVMDVVGKTVGSANSGGIASGAEIPRDGFSVLMRRVSASSWRVTVTFTRPGRWHLVVPNWILAGYVTPFPVDAIVLVRP
jgi:hypothetical protein